MPQTTRRGVAPLAPLPHWPEGFHYRAAGSRGTGEKHTVLSGLGAPILCQAAGPQTQVPGPDRNRGLSG